MHAGLAQSVERGTFNPEVKGSSPLFGGFYLEFHSRQYIFASDRSRLLTHAQKMNSKVNTVDYMAIQTYSEYNLQLVKVHHFLSLREERKGKLFLVINE